MEAGGGYFQKGIVPGLANQGIKAPVNSAGGSAQVVYHVGVPVGTSVDFRLYRNDPDVYQRFFAPETYPGGLALLGVARGQLPGADAGGSGRVRADGAAGGHGGRRCRRG